ncbi:MAG: hypothetical protein ACI9P7_000119 [Candidatus Azotimanducaceae bacterium]|jgi:uncharacterized protein (DUF427 family)
MPRKQTKKVPLISASAAILAAREKWQYRGQTRPQFAVATTPEQESVWDFPRPPILEIVENKLSAQINGQIVAETQRGCRVLETAGAPTYYFPPEDVLVPITTSGSRSICEWKGVASSLSVQGVPDAAWRYEEMFPEFESIYMWVAFYPQRVDCFVGLERVKPQPGGYYGGWVTNGLAGPIKGEAGSSGW